jgi:hypothetical protein
MKKNQGGFKKILQNSNGELATTESEKIDSITDRYESK